MITDTILHKYLRHLNAVTDNGPYPHMDAVELAFRLALEELADAMQAQSAEVAELRSQLAQLDADNATLIRCNKELTDALYISENGTALVVKNPPFGDGPADAATQSAISNQQSPINNSMWHGADMLKLLDDEAADWWIGCDTGRHTWRTVPKPVQLRMVRHILSFGPETGNMTMAEFDAIKPDWMPGSGSHTKTLNLSWAQLNDWRVEL